MEIETLDTHREICNNCGECIYIWTTGNKDSDDIKMAIEKHRCKE